MTLALNSFDIIRHGHEPNHDAAREAPVGPERPRLAVESGRNAADEDVG